MMHRLPWGFNRLGFNKPIPQFTERAIDSQSHSPGVHERAERFREKFLNRLQLLEKEPFAFGNLTVRNTN